MSIAAVAKRNYSFQPALQITPNPSAGETNITFQTEWDEQVTVKIYGLDGKEVATLLNEEVARRRNLHHFTFDGSHLPTGVYILHLATESGEVQREKLVISR